MTYIIITAVLLIFVGVFRLNIREDDTDEDYF